MEVIKSFVTIAPPEIVTIKKAAPEYIRLIIFSSRRRKKQLYNPDLMLSVMILILYDSCTGNTQAMAEAIAQGAQEEGAKVFLKVVDDATFDDLIKADAIIWGCPTYFGMMTAKMKKFVDHSNDIWGELDTKIGAAFTSSGGISGGNETALFSLIQAMLIHGMIVTSLPGRYGVVAIGKPDKKTLENCAKLGRRVASMLRT